MRERDIKLSSEILIIIGLLIGILAYILLYLGKGIQKYAIEGLKVDKSIKSKHSGIWIIGLILTTTYMFVQWIALIFAPINIIAPLEGIGLIILLVFSYYILHEQIFKIQIIGVICIILGIILVNITNPNPGDINLNDLSLTALFTFLIPVIIFEIISILISRSKGYIAAGLIIGITAGTFNAFQTVSKRITAITDPTLTILFTFITFLTGILTLLFTQYAFAKAKANMAVPCYTSASISLAVIIGFVALNEIIGFMQIIGIIVIILGIIFVSAFSKEDQKKS